MWNLINYNNDGNDNSSTFTLWGILGFNNQAQNEMNGETDKNENNSNNKDDNDNTLKTESNIEIESIKTIDSSTSDKKGKRKKKKKKTETEKIIESRNKSPFFSDMSSYADYCTSDDGKDNYNLNFKSGNFLSNDYSYKNYLALPRAKSNVNVNDLNNSSAKENVAKTDAKTEKNENTNEKNNDDREDASDKETDVNNVSTNEKNKDDREDASDQETNVNNENTDSKGYNNDWFFEKIKEIFDPSINHESISEIITNKYNSFNETHVGFFDMIDSLLLRSNTQEKVELDKKKKNYFLHNRHNSMDDSTNENYNFINYSIYCINKELSATVELEASQMMKAYNNAYNVFKKNINYHDEFYTDILNEAQEYATLIMDEKDQIKKIVSKIDFLILININSDNYNNIIESHDVQTQKLNMEEIFKINVN